MSSSEFRSGSPHRRQLKAVAGLLAFSSFTAGGVSAFKPSYDSTEQPVPYKLSSYTTAYTKQPPVRANSPPSVLPPAVTAVKNSVVKVFNEIGKGYDVGSGIKVGPNVVLTAGHVILIKSDPSKQLCTELGTENVHKGNDDKVTGWTTRYNPHQPNKRDLGLLRIRHNPRFRALPTAKIATSAPAQGESVYFINYQVGPHDMEHYPNAQAAVRDGYSRRHGHAAKYAGVVLGQRGQDWVVATNFRSYSTKPDAERNLYGGGSGGLVANGAGQAIGLSVASDDRIHTHRSIEKQYDVDLPPSPSGDYRISFVQIVTPSLLANYETQYYAPTC